MQVEFLFGPAGSGKTHRCLEEIRGILHRKQEGPPLILLAPKQATFELERALLADGQLTGYSRLEILSFERLARAVFWKLQLPEPRLLDEEGRVMVLRALLSRHHADLKIFHASARLPGFAQKISLLLRELQQHGITLSQLDELLAKVPNSDRLDEKLADLRLLLGAYAGWLRKEQLEDSEALLERAAQALESHRKTTTPPQRLLFSGLWMDGFAQMTPQERRLLLTVLPLCERATLAFCLPKLPGAEISWHSPWTLIGETVRQCYAQATAQFPGAVHSTILCRDPARTRFAKSAALQHLEQGWTDPTAFVQETSWEAEGGDAPVRIIQCPHPDAEATWVAREIVRYVRGGGRYRDVGITVRQLDAYHHSLRRIFRRYSIPLFVDRREPVAHHPLAELTRQTVRTILYGWKRADLFAALKSGLFPLDPDDVDLLENEALARGWEGDRWLSPLSIKEDPELAARLEKLRLRFVPPLLKLQGTLGSSPAGQTISQGLQEFWRSLSVEKTLDAWTTETLPGNEVHSLLHHTVWEQMHDWLSMVALAFGDEQMPLAEWLQVLTTGLVGLTVGVIPPVLDQVLLGSIDRSRNPDLRRIYILGMNEKVFPAPPETPNLLTAADRDRLAEAGCVLGPHPRAQIGHERFYGYIACTRAREQVVATYAQRDAEGHTLNPSAFISHLHRLFPQLHEEIFVPVEQATQVEHSCEIVAPYLRSGMSSGGDAANWNELRSHPALETLVNRLQHLHRLEPGQILSPALAERLYGHTLFTSASQLEKFASCPFRFFISAGLRAQERLRFELDRRAEGSFQHDVLAEFHHRLRAQGKRWRDLKPDEAKDWVATIAHELLPTFGEGLLVAEPRSRFMAGQHIAALQSLVGTLTQWFTQYEFDPETVELGFGGPDDPLKAWELDLEDGHRLAFRGRIDRVDLLHDQKSGETLCVIIDYKSTPRQIDPLLLEHGVQHQLPAYLNVLRRLPDLQAALGVKSIVPAGLFYVSLRGDFQRGENRTAVLTAAGEAARLAYQHQGRFNEKYLVRFDNRSKVDAGDQFVYRKTKKGSLDKRSAGIPPDQFEALLDRLEERLREMGRQIYQGNVRIDPFKKGQVIACTHCDYQSICRIDPWTHQYRILKRAAAKDDAADEQEER